MRVRIVDRNGVEVKSYEIAAGRGESVLDLLERIREAEDPSLSFYAACRTGKCGACGMIVNGESRLACTCLTEGENLELAPLKSGEFVRDLLTIHRAVTGEGGEGDRHA